MSKAPMPDSALGDNPMPSSFDDDLDFWDEGRYSKILRRLREEPLIPLGLGLTCYALYNAARSMRGGDKKQTNRWFRARIYAQAFTLVAVVVGSMYYKEDREKRKLYQGLLAEKRQREKKQAWLKELEARDREDREEKARIKAKREGRSVTRQQILEKLDQEDLEREESRQRAATAAARKGTVASCPLEPNQLQGTILGPAMRLWWNSGDGKK